MAYAREGQIIQFPFLFMNDTRKIFNSLISKNPKIKIASLGYDLMSFDRSEECKKQISQYFPGPLFIFRKLFIETITRIFKQMEKEYPKNFIYVPVWGTLQKNGGIQNTPNIFYCSPAKYFRDCIHPNDDGYSILMKYFLTKLNERGFFQ